MDPTRALSGALGGENVRFHITVTTDKTGTASVYFILTERRSVVMDMELKGADGGSLISLPHSALVAVHSSRSELLTLRLEYDGKVRGQEPSVSLQPPYPNLLGMRRRPTWPTSSSHRPPRTN